MTAIGMDARTTPTRHGLANIFEITWRISRTSSDEDSCHQVHFRIYGRVVHMAPQSK